MLSFAIFTIGFTFGVWLGFDLLKGISAEIEPALKEEVLSLPDILRKHYWKG